jgi:hypothetical protein
MPIKKDRVDFKMMPFYHDRWLAKKSVRGEVPVYVSLEDCGNRGWFEECPSKMQVNLCMTVCMYVCVCVYLSVHVCTYVCMYVSMYASLEDCGNRSWFENCATKNVCIIHVYIYTYTYMHTYIHTYVQITPTMCLAGLFMENSDT